MKNRKKYPDLHRRCTLNLGDPERVQRPQAAPAQTYHGTLTGAAALRRQSRARLHGSRQLEREHRSRDAGPGHAHVFYDGSQSLGVRVATR